MSHIEHTITFTPIHDVTQAKQGASGKQAWLYSLEKAGLSEALSKTRILPGLDQRAQNNVPEPQVSPPMQKIYPSALSEADAVATLQPRLHDSPALEKVATHQPRVYSAAKLVDQSLVVPATSQVSVKLTEAGIGDVSMRYWLSLLKPTAEWSLKNMVALNSGHGLEIWVRDPDLDSDPRIRAFLKDLHQTMGSLGASLVRVVINGQQNYLLDQSQHTSLRSHDGR